MFDFLPPSSSDALNRRVSQGASIGIRPMGGDPAPASSAKKRAAPPQTTGLATSPQDHLKSNIEDFMDQEEAKEAGGGSRTNLRFPEPPKPKGAGKKGEKGKGRGRQAKTDKSGDLIAKAQAQLDAFQCNYGADVLWDKRPKKRAFETACKNLNETATKLSDLNDNASALELAQTVQKAGVSAENTFDLMQQIRSNPSALVREITTEQSECILALDRGLLSNMLLFVATEFIKQIDGAEDWGFGLWGFAVL